MPLTPPPRTVLRVQGLEERCVPAGLNVLQAGSTLLVYGTAGDDRIEVRSKAGAITVDGVGGSWNANVITKVTIYGYSGNDYISLNSQDTPGQSALPPAWVFLGNGNDTVVGTPNNDLISAGTGRDYIYGGGSNDTILNRSATASVAVSPPTKTFADGYLPPASSDSSTVINDISSRQGGQYSGLSGDDIRQQQANTCSFMASLSDYARNHADQLAGKIGYDPSTGSYLIKIFAHGVWTTQSVKFDGTWTANEPDPGAKDASGHRDYWPILFQRAFLQAYNVDSTSSDLNQWAVRGTTAAQWWLQDWRYADTALQSLTGAAVQQHAGFTDADLSWLTNATRGGETVIANTQTLDSKAYLLNNTGLWFSHTYSVIGVNYDASGNASVTLRNPWGFDGAAQSLNQLSPAARQSFTGGNESDGYVTVSWSTFKQAFATAVAS